MQMYSHTTNRSNKFLILGLSLSFHLDNNQPIDFIKSLTSTLSEFDHLDDDNYKPKIVSNEFHFK